VAQPPSAVQDKAGFSSAQPGAGGTGTHKVPYTFSNGSKILRYSAWQKLSVMPAM